MTFKIMRTNMVFRVTVNGYRLGGNFESPRDAMRALAEHTGNIPQGR